LTVVSLIPGRRAVGQQP